MGELPLGRLSRSNSNSRLWALGETGAKFHPSRMHLVLASDRSCQRRRVTTFRAVWLASFVGLTACGGELEPDFMEAYTEALFLGSGPFSPRDRQYACVGARRSWTGFARGSQLRVLISSTVGTAADGIDARQLLLRALSDVESVTLGALSIEVEATTEGDPRPLAGEVTVTDRSDPIRDGCSTQRGCTITEFNSLGEMRSSRIVINEALMPADAYVHDVVGHGILGLCHIDQYSIGGNAVSLMAGGPGSHSGRIPDALSPMDQEAIQRVWASGLSPGSVRADFVRAKLIAR